MSNILPSLWYDKEAAQAAEWYLSLFKKGAIIHRGLVHDTPGGDLDMIEFRLANLPLFAMSAGPIFRLNSSISLMVSFDNKEEVSLLYETLSKGGKVHIPLADYEFSSWYTWVEDKYGLNWQLMTVDRVYDAYKVVPCLLFSGEVNGKAEEAVAFYESVFPDVQRGQFSYYKEGEAALPTARVNYGEFTIGNIPFVVMDNGTDDETTFNEAFSFQIFCENQEEIDYYWEKMSAVPEAEQCGWIKDQFGVSWQIIPAWLEKFMKIGTQEEVDRVNQALLPMKKIDLAALQAVLKR